MAEKNIPKDTSMEELKGDFDQQQAMIQQMRDVLKQKESRKRDQDKEIEDYATRLAKMKPRLMRGKGRGRGRERDDRGIKRETRSLSTEDQPPDLKLPDSPLHIPTLDDAAPLEDKPQVPLKTTPVSPQKEEVVTAPAGGETGNRSRILLLRKQLEENRIKFERQQRENADKKAAMEDMKERIDKMRNEIEQRDTVIQSLKDDDSMQLTEANVQHLYQQIMQKDNCLFDLTDKVQQLEGMVQDQREQLDEKDQVISARTEAVSLVAKDRDEKMVSTVQELEELRLAMRNMQCNFTEKEEIWLNKEKSLNARMEEQGKNVSVLEENCQRIENIRFELSARNAELQEKVVTMQSASQNLRRDLSNLRTQNEGKNKEIKELKTKLNRAESFGAKKLKALEKQVKNISKDSDVGSKILELENKIAELEEEKGNLQLKLVDFDDLKTSSDELTSSVKSLEEKLEQVNEEIVSQMKSVSVLEKEKINLVENLNAKSLTVNSKVEEMNKVSAAGEELQQTKVTLELRVCALEEERDAALKMQKDIESEQSVHESMEELHITTSKLKYELTAMQDQLLDRDQKIHFLDNMLKEKENMSQMAFEERENKISENKCLISMLAEKENTMTVQLIAIEKHGAVVEKLEKMVKYKDNVIEEKIINCTELENKMQELLQSLSQQALLAEGLEDEISSLQQRLASSESNIASLKEAEKNLNTVLVEKEKTILILEGEICSSNDEVVRKSVTISDQINKLESLEQMLESKENTLKSLEENYFDQGQENMEKDARYKKLEQDIVNVQKCLKETESRLTAECETISCLLSHRDNQIAHLEHQIEIKKQEIANNQIMIDKYEGEICEKNHLFDNLVLDNESLIGKTSSLQTSLNEAQATIESYSSELSRLQDCEQQKDYLIEQIQNEKSTLIENLRSHESNSSAVEDKVSNLEKELCDTKSSIETKDSLYQQLQMEFQAFACNKENELSQWTQIMTEKEAEIMSLKEKLELSSGEASETVSQIEKWQLELKEKSDILSTLEIMVGEKDQNIQELTSKINNKMEEMETLQQQVGLMQNEMRHLNGTIEAQIQTISDFSDKCNNLEQEVKTLLESKQGEEATLQNLSHELDEKNKFIIGLQSSFDNAETNKNAESLQQIQILQKQLDATTAQNNQITQYYDSLLIEEKQSSSNLEEQLNQVNTAHQSEMTELKNAYDQLCASVSEQQSSLSMAVQDKQMTADYLTEVENKLKQLELQKTAFEKEVTEKNDLISSLNSEMESLQKDVVSPEDFFDQIQAPVVTSPPIDSLKDENESLKMELIAAKQAIVRLETSLATQAEQHSDSSADTVESWGVVDLGEPSISGPDSMTTSLIEKDKTLTVIQEQLKEALEQVNTVSDSKKLIQHQMNTLEAELNHSKTKISELEEQITKSNDQIERLSKENMSLIKEAQRLASSVLQTEEIENNAANWFEQSSTQSAKGLFENLTPAEQEEQQTPPVEREQSPTIIESQGQTSSDIDQAEIMKELQYKISWYEENWASWSSHCEQLQQSLEISQQQLQSANEQLQIASQGDTESLTTLQLRCEDLEASLQQEQVTSQGQSEELQQVASKLEEASLEVDRLRQFETQVYELQSQIQTLQHQSSILETKVSEAESSWKKLQEYEYLYGELQTSMQEAETKREGSKSRVQELELMVQSAETEIGRLRSQMQTLTDSLSNSEKQKVGISEELENLKEELRKVKDDKQTVEEEMNRLQKEASNLHSQLIDSQATSQRLNAEVEQLRSEVDVLEGDGERLRSSYEILESEHNRVRSEHEMWSQSSQMLTAQNESLETEIQRLRQQIQSLSLDGDHSRGEMQRLSEVGTSAESEITRLQQELNHFRTLNTQYQEMEQKYIELQNSQQQQQSQKEIQLDELDWSAEGKMEHEHMQRSGSVERSLEEEIDRLKQRSIDLEREKNQLNDDLQAAKLKNGKMIQKLKAANNKNEGLAKELTKLKKGGFSDLDLALEEEMKKQVKKAENERDELKVKIDEMEREKDQMTNKMDVLENAHEKYIEMKELQDVSMRQLSVSNKNLESQVATLEWKISEMEESYMEQLRSISPAEVPLSDLHPMEATGGSSSELETLKQTVWNQEQQISELNDHKMNLETNVAHLETKIEELSLDNDNIQSLLNSVNEAKRKVDSDITKYKDSFMEQHKEYADLKEELIGNNQLIEALRQEQIHMQNSYESLHKEYLVVQDSRDSYKYDYQIYESQKEIANDTIAGLQKQIEMMNQSETDEIVSELQGEISIIRDQNVTLKNEILQISEALKASEESNQELNEYIENQSGDYEMSRTTYLNTARANEELETVVKKLQNEIRYLKAESASLKKKSEQQQQAIEDGGPKLKKMQDQLDIVHKQNYDLKLQIEGADGSLAQLASQDSQNSDRSSEELQATLMSLHLRDLRCQQLSLEINKLLEERDALQLKLSAALRQNQEMTRELSQSQHLPAPTTPPPSLNIKLAELRELNSNLEERALNRFNSPKASLLPTFPSFVSHTAPATPTATRHSEYTVTRESHGSSGTLISWIMGKSPPKEVLHV